MAYVDEIQAIEQNPFNEFFEFQVKNSFYRYVGDTEARFFRTYEYLPAAIARSAFTQDTQFKAIQTTVVASVSAVFASALVNAPISDIIVRIWRAFKPDFASYRFIFFGKVKQIQVADQRLQITCESLSGYTRGLIPKYLYQAYCNHSLFDAGCKLDADAWKISAVVDSIVSNRLTSTTFATKPSGYFKGGMVYLSSGDDARLVTNHFGDQIALHFPFLATQLTLGDTVVAYPGCDKSGATCRDKFSNLAKRLAFDYIPSANPAIVGFR